jgi:hypothetical protein
VIAPERPALYENPQHVMPHLSAISTGSAAVHATASRRTVRSA